MLFILIVGWDRTGFKRFTYTGTYEEFAQGVSYPMSDFVGSPVFYTLLVMGLVLVPTYTYLVMTWRKA